MRHATAALLGWRLRLHLRPLRLAGLIGTRGDRAPHAKRSSPCGPARSRRSLRDAVNFPRGIGQPISSGEAFAIFRTQQLSEIISGPWEGDKANLGSVTAVCLEHLIGPIPHGTGPLDRLALPSLVCSFIGGGHNKHVYDVSYSGAALSNY